MENITDKKRAIFESTLVLVKEKGFHGTPMSQIAKNAGVAAGTIYHHFDSKETLILELYSYIRDKMLDAMLQLDNEAMNYKDRFFNFWISHCLFYIKNPNALFFMEQFVNSPYSNRDPLQDNERFQNTFRDLIKTGVETGVLKSVNSLILSALIHGTIVNTAKIHLCRRINMGQAELQQIVELIWDGMRNIPNASKV
ncbi:TetR/AcrR family transcriptional regulator [Adhaeribacter rhizoryzae]|uniref:TetR/AcrR family transcriptional regulator n=1 Tax=Adhaeribacter rhizoryzae TaxID=2607907 RepID=A0A5M6D7S7_9BACT|nr:TetR/AcrR family transcriptional regulator [Adhaeribacter rhizoryzae]KAA5543403.1 TetR/AcrR family transcriptional regulator [Adhaeribacter rhizoryzae]